MLKVRNSTEAGATRYPPQWGGRGIAPEPIRARIAAVRIANISLDGKGRLCSYTHEANAAVSAAAAAMR
jgi:hypothetical protein